jgi:hypothetical protein
VYWWFRPAILDGSQGQTNALHWKVRSVSPNLNYEQRVTRMKVWVLHDDDEDGSILGIHGVTSDAAIAKLWEIEYKYYKADAFELDDMSSIAEIFEMNGEASPHQ